MLETEHRHGLACQTLYTDRLRMSKKFRIGTNVYSEHVSLPSY